MIFLIGSKFYIEIEDWTAGNLEQTEAAIQDQFQRIINLVMGRSLSMTAPMPQECRNTFEFMENVFSEGRFADHFFVSLQDRRAIVRSLEAAEFILYSSMLLEHPEIVNFLRAH